MPLSDRRWKQFAESRYAHEREALEFLRDVLPDRDPVYLYSNFEFIADDGSVNEVDALVVTQAGVFVVELKSRGGIVTGNRHLWDWNKDGHTITVDSPLTLTNSKARKLAGLLSKQKAFRGERAPWIEALVFLSAPGISVRLADSERMRICEREPRDKKPGVVSALLQREYYGNESSRGPFLDISTARRFAKALEEAGIRPSQRQRRVGDYVLKELIEENPLFAYQDFQAEHPTTKASRRVRLYTVAGKDKATHEAVRRAALQEFQILESLDHPGILRALDFNEHELGPAILFRREPDEVRLDHFLRQRGATLPLDIRLNLVRQIADAVQYAHKHRVVHRTLSPKSILVVHPDSDRPEVRLFNWQAGRVLATGSTSGTPASRTSTLHPSQYSEESTLCYLAPESVLDPRGRDPMADVFSMGAVAFHIFSGRPPATSATELNQVLSEHKGLSLGAALDGATSGLQELVREATAPDLLLRTESARNFLDNLDRAENELTAPPQQDMVDPLEAKPGDLITKDLKVLKRLGGGSCAVALLVERGDEILVLKYGRDSKDGDRIEKEYQTLDGLRHELIVSAKGLLNFPNGHKGFLMEYAGEWDRKKEPSAQKDDTLARELKAVGRLSIEFLGRFGDDLLHVVQYLEEKGVAHRDLKPDNIGIKEYGKKLHLKIFDFSLSNAPLDNVRVGTPPYLEPFLQLRNRWDTAAERYSAAVILYEMATGTTPRWGDGQSAPHLIDADVTIDADLFDAPVRQDLHDFFRRAFQRNPRQRFDNATDMLLAWQNIFHRATVTDSRLPDPDAQELAFKNLRPDTLLSQIGLSTRAQNTLDRLSIFTAQELAAQPPGRFSNLRGVGNKTRREIMDLVGKLRSKFPPSAIPERSPADAPLAEKIEDESAAPLSVDALTALLIPVERSASGKVSRQILAAFLELDDAAPGPPQYPTQAQIAERTGRARAQISQTITKARDRWRRSVPQLTPIRTELAEFIAAEGGVAHIAELAQFLLASRRSDAPEPLATRRAAAVVRAALEAEKPSESCRFEERRHGDLYLIARSEAPFGEAAIDYAEKLAAAGRTLSGADTLPSPARVLETLRAIPAPIPGLRDDRLVRVAAAHPQVAVSPRLELYPRDLDALRALKLAQSSLAGVARITADELRTRVHDRYPEAQPLPDPPELHRLVEEAGLGLTPDTTGTVYVAPSATGIASSTSLHRYQTIVSPLPDGGAGSYLPPIEQPREIEEAIEFERRLKAAYRAPSYLVLATEPRLKYLEMALKNIAKHFPMEVFHCEREFIAALRKEAEAKRVKWEVVLRADAAKPTGNGQVVRDWENLRKLATNAARSVADQLCARTKSTLIIYPGLLARYGQLNILDELADSIGQHSLWLLAGSDRQAASPMIDGQAIPARATQWGWIPPKWLNNEFRKTKGGPAA